MPKPRLLNDQQARELRAALALHRATYPKVLAAKYGVAYSTLRSYELKVHRSKP